MWNRIESWKDVTDVRALKEMTFPFGKRGNDGSDTYCDMQ